MRRVIGWVTFIVLTLVVPGIGRVENGLPRARQSHRDPFAAWKSRSRTRSQGAGCSFQTCAQRERGRNPAGSQ
jgi:hypothetical protein